MSLTRPSGIGNSDLWFIFLFRQAVELIYKAVDFGFKADYRNRPFFRSETLTLGVKR